MLKKVLTLILSVVLLPVFSSVAMAQSSVLGTESISTASESNSSPVFILVAIVFAVLAVGGTLFHFGRRNSQNES